MTPSYVSVPTGPAGARRAATFAGASVFLSRNLVAPEVFDAVHDALRLNGAEVFLCADPGRTGPLDFHIISSSSHEKFAYLKAKGCKLLGPQCVLSCAKERRSLPKQSYTCCLAMDGVKILCSGFEKAEKAKIEELVTAMGGLLETNRSMDVNFVIVKDVMAVKYKWAVNTLKKPVVTMNWLEQCWIEHRVVPHEPYRILPFTGLNICVTKLNQACVDENSYLVCHNSSVLSGIKSSLKDQHNPEISSASASFQPVTTTSVDDSVSTSQFVPTSVVDAGKNSSPDIVGASCFQETNEMQVVSHVAEDSEAENDDMYLSNCRISLVGFDEKEMLRLVILIRNGGGSRHILLSEKLTHIVLGAPSDDEKREVRRLASWGIINVVKVTWLEDRSKAKKEVKVSPIHVATDLLLKEFSHVSMEKSADTRETKVAKSSCGIFHVPTVNDSHRKELEKDTPPVRKPGRGKHDNMDKAQAARSTKSSQQNGGASFGDYRPSSQVAATMNSGSSKSSNIFKGRTFGFSNSFSHDKVVDWVRQGGGIIVDDIQSIPVEFIIECHGRSSMPCDFSRSTVVSTQWIRSCLEEGCLQDVTNHPIFSPLRCRVPLPGFEKIHFCISQYEEKERCLLKNLCFTLGAKFSVKAKKGVTHLICKFAIGQKYEAYSRRGTPSITAEWLFECVKQDKDANLCTVSQYSTQVARFDCSEPLTGCQNATSNPTDNSGIATANEETSAPAVNKRRRLSASGKAGDTCENIGRAERKLDSSSIFEPDNSTVVQERKDTHSFGISRNWLNMQQKQENTPGTQVQSLNSSPTPSPVPAPYYPFSETQTESQIVGYEEDLTGKQKIIDRVRSQSINVTPSNEMP
ncbi:hypothetical protein EJB05_28784 [Eragrostis curvula]|uniref:BRCT domain-containing protein n=1 Tax=Eragrostis curvula TaxID=38414 RepID=A0A5J9USX3_9POAL|nr:hypothetical protein EJB05_28784 [Eragrostis curvula]